MRDPRRRDLSAERSRPRARGRLRLALLAPALALALGHAAALPAQVVVGAVTDLETAGPVSTAVVVLLDGGDRRVATVLTDEAGRFTVTAPRAGRYALRVERIGFRSHTSDPLDLAVGDRRVVALSVRSEAVQLPGIVAEGERYCRMPRQEGLVISDLWGEARKALELSAWPDGHPGVQVRTALYERTLDLATLDVLEERVRTRSGHTRDPFVGRPAEELERDGYVQPNDDGSYAYFGLGAPALLSSAFEASHCFRVRPPGPRQLPTEIGLAFEPARRGRTANVEGVLWVDRETGMLQRVEYRYTRHPFPVALPPERFGGRTIFRRLENGAVVVDSWWIRMPDFARDLDSAALPPRPHAMPAGTLDRVERIQHLGRLGLRIREVGGRATVLSRTIRP